MRRFLLCLGCIAAMMVVACDHNDDPEPGAESDYVLGTDEDVIIPPAGTATAWVTVRGVDDGGYNQGRVYYVSPTGNDGSAGSREAPWATPAKAAAKLHPGDTLVILARDAAKRPILAGRGNLSRGFDLSGVSYVRLENLELTNDGDDFRDGLQAMERLSEHVRLRDLYFHHLDEFGLNLGDINDWEIRNCDITYCGYGAMGGPAGQNGGWRNVKIVGCDLSYSGHYYQGGAGPSPYDRPDGFGIEPSDGPIEIAATTARHNRGDGLDSKAKATYIHECIVANNSCDGVKLWGDGSAVENTLIYGRGDGSSEGTPWSAVVIHTEEANAAFRLTNVTVDDELGKNYLMHVQYDYQTTPIDVTLTNVIWSSRGEDAPVFVGGATRLTATHNLFWFPNTDTVLEHGSRTYTRSNIGSLGAGDIYGNPLFERTAFGDMGDYRVKTGSPAIDRGTSAGAPAKDLNGAARPRGGGYDIGCYER